MRKYNKRSNNSNSLVNENWIGIIKFIFNKIKWNKSKKSKWIIRNNNDHDSHIHWLIFKKGWQCSHHWVTTYKAYKSRPNFFFVHTLLNSIFLYLIIPNLSITLHMLNYCEIYFDIQQHALIEEFNMHSRMDATALNNFFSFTSHFLLPHRTMTIWFHQSSHHRSFFLSLSSSFSAVLAEFSG